MAAQLGLDHAPGADEGEAETEMAGRYEGARHHVPWPVVSPHGVNGNLHPVRARPVGTTTTP